MGKHRAEVTPVVIFVTPEAMMASSSYCPHIVQVEHDWLSKGQQLAEIAKIEESSVDPMDVYDVSVHDEIVQRYVKASKWY